MMQFAEQARQRLPADLLPVVMPMLDHYRTYIDELTLQQSKDQGSLKSLQAELRATHASVQKVVEENESLRREVKDSTAKLLDYATRSDNASPSAVNETVAELETITELLRSENNVLLSQRRALAEEVQAVKMARGKLESELAKAREGQAGMGAELQDAVGQLRERDRAVSSLQHEVEMVQARAMNFETEAEESRSEATRCKEGLKQSQIEAEEARMGLDELRSRARLETATQGRDGEDVQKLVQELQELQEKQRVRNREYDEMGLHCQELTQAMSSFEQRSVECQQKDIEVFNIREETKELLANASMEKDAVMAREQAVQRRCEVLGEKLRVGQAELTEQFESERETMKLQHATSLAAAVEKLDHASLANATMMQKMERAERESRSLNAELQRLTEQHSVTAVQQRVAEVAHRLATAQQERDVARQAAQDAESEQERMALVVKKQESEAIRRVADLEQKLARVQREAAEHAEENRQLRPSVEQLATDHRATERQLEQLTARAKAELTSQERNHVVVLEDLAKSHNLALDRERRAAHGTGSHSTAAAWQAKFDAASQRFDSVVADLQTQNSALRTRSSGGSGGSGGSGPGGAGDQSWMWMELQRKQAELDRQAASVASRQSESVASRNEAAGRLSKADKLLGDREKQCAQLRRREAELLNLNAELTGEVDKKEVELKRVQRERDRLLKQRERDRVRAEH